MEGLNSKQKGFTIVEILIDLMIISLVATAIISAYAAAYKSINLAKSKMMAVTIANEKMERIRNMPYDNLATAHGSIYPPGAILDDETVEQNGVQFNIHTIIKYVDDLFDGNAEGTIAGKPTDAYPYDYKHVEINVGILGRNSRLANISTSISAKAAETPTNTGIVNLCVVDSQGNPVSEANVLIKNSEISPNLELNIATGDTGCILVPKLPPDEHNHYSIIVTKDGYSSDQTYPRTAQNPNALNPDINVISQQVTNATFVIDRLSKINLSFLDQNGNRVPGINFKLSGGDLIYNNPDTKRFDSNFTSDLNGQITIPDLKFDSYTIEVLTTGYYLISTVPVSDINLPSGTSLDAKAILSASSTNPAATGVSPMTGVSPDNATVTITGRNFSNNTSVKMINRSSGFEITGKNITAKAQKELSADFDLAGAETGEYDLFIQNINGEKVTQEKAFSVVSN